jgi:hypothetical protein
MQFAPDDDKEAIRREKIEFKNQQERFLSVVLDSLTDPGSEVEDHFLDRLSNFLCLFPHVGQKVDEILGAAYERHKDFERGLLIATIFECLNRL